MINVLIDTSPLATGHAIRGIGMYTRYLTEYLEKSNLVKVVRSGSKEAKKFKPDIVHYPFFDLFFNTLPLAKKAKTVVTIHDVIPLKYPDFYPVGIKGKLRFEKQKLALQRIDGVITDSISSKNDIVEHLKTKQDKIHIVYLAGNPEIKYQNEKMIKKIKRKYALPKDYILYVGDINYNKNIPQLIKAVKYLPPKIKLVCVGRNFYPHDIPEWQWIEAQMVASQVEHRIKFLTDITGDATTELAAIYSGALAYVQPSLYEGFGLPVLEAMQCKTPVVSSKTSSLLEVGDDYVEFAQETTGESFGKAINKVLEMNDEDRKKIVDKALIWSESFSWDRVAEETIKVYQKIIAN